MKKAKIALSAIALLGVTGSIFAFKTAKRSSAPPYYITSAANVAANATWTKGATVSPAGTGVNYFISDAKGGTSTRLTKITKGD